MSANERQVGGSHYAGPVQHWDFAASNDFDYFQGQITKYVTRWKRKGGVQDLEKALHFLQKYLEVVKARGICGGPPPGRETCDCDPAGACPYRDTSGPRIAPDPVRTCKHGVWVGIVCSRCLIDAKPGPEGLVNPNGSGRSA